MPTAGCHNNFDWYCPHSRTRAQETVQQRLLRQRRQADFERREAERMRQVYARQDAAADARFVREQRRKA
jgi:hypothetical protein